MQYRNTPWASLLNVPKVLSEKFNLFKGSASMDCEKKKNIKSHCNVLDLLEFMCVCFFTYVPFGLIFTDLFCWCVIGGDGFLVFIRPLQRLGFSTDGAPRYSLKLKGQIQLFCIHYMDAFTI